MDSELQRSPSWQTITGMVCLFVLVSLAVQVWHPPGSRAGRKVLGEPQNDDAVSLSESPVHAFMDFSNGPDTTHHFSPISNSSAVSIGAEIRLFELVDLGAFSTPPTTAPTAPAVAAKVTPEFIERLQESVELIVTDPLGRDAADGSLKNQPGALSSYPSNSNPESTSDSLSTEQPAIDGQAPQDDDPFDLPQPNLSPQAPDSAKPSQVEINSGNLAEGKQAPISDAPIPASVWPEPTSLLQRLSELSRTERLTAARSWARETREQIEKLSKLDSLTSAEAKATLRKMAELNKQVQTRLGNSQNDNGSEVWRCIHAVNRRLALWQAIYDVETQPVFVTYEPSSITELSKKLRSVEQLLSDLSNDDEWRKYLLLHELRSTMSVSSIEGAQQRSHLARRILIRMTAAELNEEQERLLQQREFADLQTELRRHATTSVDYVSLLKDFELLDRSTSSAQTTRIADAYQTLRWSTDPTVANLASEINGQYRNANVRIAVSAEMLNRLLPDPQMYDAPVDDQMLGARVRGMSRTISRLRVVLVPDRWQWRMNLEANGEVAAETTAVKGPAKLLTDAISNYQARKPLFISPRLGLQVRKAEASAASATDLRCVETDFDRVPLFGAIARSIAIQKHNESHELANRLTENQVASRASQVFDQEVNQRLVNIEREFERKLLVPLRRLNLKPTAIDMETTPERLIVRYRLAADRQLASYTPRPRAPSDSLFSFQIHESALNNTLENLNLSGKEKELVAFIEELKAHFGEILGTAKTDEIPEGVTITFAKQDPMRVQFQDGRVVFTLRMAKVETRDNAWKNFVVRIKFRPSPEGQAAQLTSEGYELSGDRLGNRLGIRVILSKLFPDGRKFDMLASRVTNNPKLSDLSVNQFSAAEGWIGLAVGPKSGPVQTAKASMGERVSSVPGRKANRR